MSGSIYRAFRRAPATSAHRLIERLERRRLLSVSIEASADAFAQRAADSPPVQQSNFGADPQLRVDVSADNTAETFLSFDISAAGDVGHALLRLRGGQSPSSDEPILVGAFAVPQPGWIEGNGTAATSDTDNTPEGEVTWNARPGTSGAALDAAHVTRTGDYYWNVTAYVRAQKQAGATAVSFALRNVDGNPGLVTFDAREAGATGPVLVVEPNAAGPVGAFTAPNLTAAAATQQITATYTDTDPINVESIDVDDLVVVAPGRPAAQVTDVAVTASSPTLVTAVYTVVGPSGGWQTSDNALWTALLQTGQVTDAAGNTAVGGPDGYFVSIGDGSPGSSDVSPPAAQVWTADVSEAGGATGLFTVTYTDDSAINISTIDIGDVTVERPGSPSLRVTGVAVNPSANGSPITATYTFNAPGGSWSGLDNGTYVVRVAGGAVADVAGRLNSATTGEFVVNVPASPPAGDDTIAPTAVVAALLPIIVPDVATQQVRVTYSDNAAIDFGSIDISDLAVTRNGVTLTVVGVSANPPVDGNLITAIYSVAAPSGTFGLSDNGTYAVAVAPGAVVDTSGNAIAAATGSFEVALPAPRPTLDPTFGNGIVTADIIAEGSVVQPDGRVLIAGRLGDLAAGTSQGVLQRYLPDGSLDTSFGNGGQLVTTGGNDAYYAVRLAPGGTIVVAGTSDGNFSVTRFKSSGAVDRSFGFGGRAIADFAGSDVAYALAIGPDGSIVAGGTSSVNGTSFALARFLQDGKADIFFGENGRSLFQNGTGAHAIGAVALQSDGKILAAGGSGTQASVIRVGADGMLDPTYGQGGVATVNTIVARDGLEGPDYSCGLAVQSDDQAVVGNRSADGDFAVVRLTTAGQLDNGFGDDGVATIDFGVDDDVDMVLIQGTGEIFAVGTTTGADRTQTAVAALGRDGTLDAEFGSGGKLVVDASATPERALHIGDLVLRAFASVGADGRLLVGNSSGTGGGAAAVSGLRRLNVPGSGLVGLFGVVEGRTASLRFLDGDGTAVTLTLKGGGTARAFFDGTNIDLVVSGTTPQSVLRLKGSGGNGRISLRNLQTDGSLRSLQANTTDLSGTLSVDGSVQTLQLGTVTGTLASAGSMGTVKLLGDVNGGRLLAGADLGSDGKLGGSASEADGFAAATIGKLVIRGKTNAALVAVGVDPRNGVFLDSDDQVLGGSDSRIGSIRVRGGADLASRFVAGDFGPARLPDPATEDADGRLQVL